MRILIATPLYPPEVGGPATYSRLLEVELPKRGFDITVVKWRDVRDWPRLVRHIAYFWRVFKLGRDADIIFALDPVSVGLPAWCAAWLLRKRFFLKVVGDFAWEQWESARGGQFSIFNFSAKGGPASGGQFSKKESFIGVEEFQERRFDIITELRRFVERFVARRAERVVVPSEFLKRIVLAWGVPEAGIAVVYNAFDPPEAVLSKIEARQIFSAPGTKNTGGTIIFSAGRLVPWKGFGSLVGIMPDIIKQFPDAKLFIAGDGPEREAIQFSIFNFSAKGGPASGGQFSNSVRLLGRLDHETLYRYIVAADLFVLNTGYEGLSHQLLEVMALGTPIVTTDVGGNPELIEDGQSGRLVAYGDSAALKRAILELLTHPPAGGKMAMAAQKKAQEFTVERMIEETVSVLSSRA